MFGAAVHDHGRASSTLARRIDLAAGAADRFPDATLFLSGAIGRYPPSEARVMADGLRGRVDPTRLTLNEASRDTLQTARAAADHARGHGVTRCIVCTNRYHQPRARMLLRIFGVATAGIWLAQPRRQTRLAYRWRMRLREAAALPYDAVAGLAAITRVARRPR